MGGSYLRVMSMNKMWIVCFLTLFISPMVLAEPAVCLYSEVNYGGLEKCIDSINGAGSRLKLTDFNDRAKSAKVFPGFKVRVYSNYDTPGWYLDLHEDTPSFLQNNNAISSISISTDEVLSGYSACFWEHENYRGKRLCIKGITDVDLFQHGFNDIVSSVKVRSDYSLRLYRDVGFNGESFVVAGNAPSLGRGFSDVASSARAFLSSATYDKTTLAIGSDPQLYCTANCHQQLTEDEAYQKVRGTLLSMVNNNDVNAIFINGDLTEYGHANEWGAFFDAISTISGRAPVYWGIGNHDYINNNHDTYQNNAYVRTMRNMWDHLTNLTSSVYDASVDTNNDWVIKGSLGYAVDLGDVYYIQLNDLLVDSAEGGATQDLETYDYNDAWHCCSFYGSRLWSAKDFLQKQLEFAAQNDKIVVIGKHRPTLSREMAELISSYNVKLLFSGHYHNVEKNYEKGLTFYNSGSMAKGSYIKLIIDKNFRKANIFSVKTRDGVNDGIINDEVGLPIVNPKYSIGEGLWVK